MKKMKKCLQITLSILLIASLLISCKKTVKVGTKVLDASKNYTIYIAQASEKTALDDMRKGLVIGLKDQGLVEDINIKYLYENAKSNSKFADKIADNVIEKKPDVVVAIGSLVAEKIYDKCKDIPIVFLGCANADKIGFCDANGKPKGNITGVIDSHRINERLEFIENNYPNVKKLGIIYDKSQTLSTYDVDYHKFYATAHNIDIYTASIKKADDIGKALDSIMPKVDGISLAVDDTIEPVVSQIIERCRKENKPVFGKSGEHSMDGVIIEKEVDMTLVGKKAADIVNDIIVNGKAIDEINAYTMDFNE